jgi:atypical dual specificity phosphatase
MNEDLKTFMPPPYLFSWVDKPFLAGMARPVELGELQWLRQEGIELLVSLTEDPPRRDWINEAGLFLVHQPIEDMHAPSLEQLSQIMSVIARAQAKKLGVGVHCAAGLGRTGVVLACYFVTKGLTGRDAIARVRRLRQGSIETEDQEQAVMEFARHWAKA